MREITDIDEIKSIELGILKEVHAFCKQNGIRYFLMDGTLLGAIRHNGFIPWDDDVDIAMPREDYEKFAKSFSSERYKFIRCEDNKLYPLPFGKVMDTGTVKKEPIKNSIEMGIDIDVFPIDKYSEQVFEEKTLKYRTGLIKKGVQACSKFYKVKNLKFAILNVLLFIKKPFLKSANYYARKINAIAQTDSNSKDYFLFSDSTMLRPLKIDGEWIKELTLHEFEDASFYIPIGYDGLLKSLYGDYMTPPPKEQRITHHENKIYYK